MPDKRERHILITGFGGQGIVMAGDILGKAATL
ncbi:MAG: pyruvate ferredoxin oxidoreductase, partial [Deltaproteobacteria bacterium]